MRDSVRSKTAFRGRVLFVGQAYYNAWYLSRELRKLGWKADLLNWDQNADSQMYYHGEDFFFADKGVQNKLRQLVFYVRAIFSYDIFHFSNTDCLRFGVYISRVFRILGRGGEIRLLKLLGKKIVYSNNGCLDGVSQTSFSKWGPYNVCSSCPWSNRPDICGDEKNLRWGAFRNQLADYQCLLGGNREDFNIDPRVHEVPWFYCLDKNVWNPDLLIPANYRLPIRPETVKIYHSVGNFESRTQASAANIKSTHIYLEVVERLKREGYDVDLVFFHDVPNKKLRYYQVQADIFVDMLTFGFFGANVREAMMLGKPAICFLRPEWLESMRSEIPEYVDELPVISATPETVYEVLKDLVEHPEKRKEIGRRSREFAVKWHASDSAAIEFDRIYSTLLDR